MILSGAVTSQLPVQLTRVSRQLNKERRSAHLKGTEELTDVAAHLHLTETYMQT